MPKYKLKKHFKTLIQIYLFYYFLTPTVCQLSNDVEYVASGIRNNDNNEFSSERRISDSEFLHRTDERKNVNLNVNNNLESGAPTLPAGQKFTEINEERIAGQKVLYYSDSPFLLRQDLDILQYGRLIIEPGVQIQFAPMVGITVYGAINATVSSNKCRGVAGNCYFH